LKHDVRERHAAFEIEVTPDSAGIETGSRNSPSIAASIEVTPDSAGIETLSPRHALYLSLIEVTPDSAGIETESSCKKSYQEIEVTPDSAGIEIGIPQQPSSLYGDRSDP